MFSSAPLLADLPTGYLVWSKGDEGVRSSRLCSRLTLPEKNDLRALTSGEDIECQISPSGRWVAYAKAKRPDSDYHQFHLWKLYIVSIEGIHHGGTEIEIDADGYWPSWGLSEGQNDILYYSQADGQHTNIRRVTIGTDGQATNSILVLSTRSAFPGIAEINECFVDPTGSWFAGRTRGISESGVSAYDIDAVEMVRLGWVDQVGCMPYVAPSGEWGFLAGSTSGIRWGDAPGVSNRRINQQLVAAKPDGRCYHPGISTDGAWFMTGHSQSTDQNAGPWDIYIYNLSDRQASNEQLLVSGGFNGFPHIWVSGTAAQDAGPDAGPADPDAGPADPDAGPPDNASQDGPSLLDAGESDSAKADAAVSDIASFDSDSEKDPSKTDTPKIGEGCACSMVSGGPISLGLVLVFSIVVAIRHKNKRRLHGNSV